jgi:Domain of unknown function (DUF3244)
MKTSFKTIACVLALSAMTATASFATEKTGKETPRFEASAYVAKDANLLVSVSKNVPSRVTLTLKDEKNKEVYSENINKNELKASYKLNLSNLADGKYTLEITSDSQTITKQINLVSERVEVARRVLVQ